MGTELKQCRERLMEEYRATSMDRTTELELEPSMDGTKEREEGRIECPSATFIDQATEPTGNLKRHVALPINNSRRNYAEIVQSPKVKSFKMTIKSRDTHPPEKFKQILKNKINLGEIKVGVNTFKPLSEGVLIETKSKEEIEVLEKEIQVKCGDELDVHVHSLRKPRIIILNVPEDIRTENIEDTILRQNPEL